MVCGRGVSLTISFIRYDFSFKYDRFVNILQHLTGCMLITSKWVLSCTVKSGLFVTQGTKKSDKYAAVTDKPNTNIMYSNGRAISSGFKMR